MYCYKCGLQICEKALECEHCGANTAHIMKPRFFKESFVFGVLFLCAPFLGIGLSFALDVLAPFYPYYMLIFGLIGFPLSLISKRKSAIFLNIIGAVLWVMLLITPFFADNAPSPEYRFSASSEESEQNAGI